MITFDPNVKPQLPIPAPAAPPAQPSFLSKILGAFSGIQAPQVSLPSLPSTPSVQAPSVQPAPVLPKPAPISFAPVSQITFAPPAPIKAPAAQKITFNPPASPDRIVRNQDFGDVANTLADLVTAPIGATDKLGRSVGATFGLTAPALKIPNVVRDEAHGGPNSYQSTTLQDAYHQRIAEGQSKTEALAKTIGDTGLDILTALPLFEGVRLGARGLALKTVPEKLITPETLSASKEQVQDFLSGRIPQAESPLPPELRKVIAEAPDKKPFLKGIDLTKATPSTLGRLLGIDQAEAERILAESLRKPVTEPAKQLPGYIPEYPKFVPAGLSAEPVRPVGFADVQAKTSLMNSSDNPIDTAKKIFKIGNLNIEPDIKIDSAKVNQVVKKALGEVEDSSRGVVDLNQKTDKYGNFFFHVDEEAQGAILATPENTKVGDTLWSGEHAGDALAYSNEGYSGAHIVTGIENGMAHIASKEAISNAASTLYERLRGVEPQFIRLDNTPDGGTIRNYDTAETISGRTEGAQENGLQSEGDRTDDGALARGSEIGTLRERQSGSGTSGKTVQIPVQERIAIQKDAVLDQVSYMRGRMSQQDFVTRSVERAKQLNLPDESAKVLENTLSGQPKEVLQHFTGVVQNKLQGTVTAAFVVDKTGWRIEINPDKISEKSFADGSLMIHEAMAHPKYELSPNAFRLEVNKAVDMAIEKDGANAVFREIFETESNGKFVPSLYNYYVQELNRIGRTFSQVYGKDMNGISDAVAAAFDDLGLTKSDGINILSEDDGIAYYKATQNLYDQVAEYLKTKYPELWNEEAWKRIASERSSSIVRNELFARYLQKRDGLSEQARAFFAPTVFDRSARLARSDSKAFFANTSYTNVEMRITSEDPAGNASKLNKLYKQRDRFEQSLQAYEYNPEAHIKAYGEDRSAGYKAQIESINARIKILEDMPKQYITPVEEVRPSRKETEQGSRAVDRELAKESKKNREVNTPTAAETALDEALASRDDLQQTLENHPGKDLVKYVSATTGKLPEVSNRQTSKYGQRGDVINETAMQLDDPEKAQEAVDDYQKLRARFVADTKKIGALRREVAAEKLTTADQKSEAALLNKNARQTEADIVRRDNEERRRKRVIRKEDERQKILRADETKRTTLQEKINQEHYVSAQSKSFLHTLKRTFQPVRALDTKTGGIVKTWLDSRGVAREHAQELYMKSRGKGPQDLEEVNAYEAGKNTPYIRDTLDTLGQEAKDLGMDFGFRENYLPHVYAENRETVISAIAKRLKEKGLSDEEIAAYVNGQELPKDKALRLKLNPNFVKERIFPSYSAAAKYGLSPKYRSPAELLAYYQESLDIAKANRALLDKLKEEAKLLPSEDAPDTWEPVTLRFAREGLYAPPELADLLNGRFRDDAKLNLRQKFFKVGSSVSKFMFDARTMAGVPGTTINSFAIGQANKALTAAIGDVATLDFKSALSDLKSSFAFVRANSNSLSKKFFEDNKFYMTEAAKQSISFAGRPGDYQKISENILGVYPKAGERTVPKVARALTKMTGLTFNKLFTVKTTRSMLAQMNLQLFKDNYEKALESGLEGAEASAFAGKVTRTMGSVLDDLGRSPDVQETMASLLTAPVFREGVMGVLADGARSYSSDFKNPFFYKSRRFILGMAITYALYNLLNKKLSGHYMWGNTSGHEFDLRVEMPNGDVVYIPFMPSFLAFARNIGSGLINLGEGNFDVAAQKFGSLLSTPVQLATEIWSNRDYFGRAIYKTTDSAKEKLEAIATYTGLSVTHPFVQESYKYISGQEPIYQALSIASELPFKFGSVTKEQTSQYYDMLDVQAKKRADARKEIQPIYDKLQALKAEGKTAEANKEYYALDPKDKKIYDLIKSSEKQAATVKRKPAIQAIYNNLQDLKAAGNTAEADTIYSGLSPEDRKIYQSIKKASENAL